MKRLTKNEIIELDQTRRLKRIRYREISESIGVSGSALSQWFNFKSTLSVSTEQKIKNVILQTEQWESRYR
jgi:transcriptional regulator with XRE-family HTH domain